MGLFSRKPPEPKIDPRHWIGRKFRSSFTLDECLANYNMVKAECYHTAGTSTEMDWTVPTDLAGFTSTQGNNVTVKPARVVADNLAGGGRTDLAIWNGIVSQGEDSGSGDRRARCGSCLPGSIRPRSPSPAPGR